MRLIDVDLILNDNNLLYYWYFPDELVVFVRDIEQAETIDSVPVVHGHWAVESGRVCCSVCGEQSLEYNFCPYCGARMDEEG